MSKNILIILVICSSVAVLQSGCHIHLHNAQALRSFDNNYSIDRIIENINYTANDWPQPLHADLYLPNSHGLRPVVLTIHGGSWSGRSRDDMTRISRKLARHGYAVFNISYRFAPTYTYPAQVHDLQQALRWIVSNADKYSLDITRINSWGYSSGAHLAALSGTLDHDNANVKGLLPLPRIRAVVAGGIPSDLRKYSGSPSVMRFMGGDLHEMPERYAEASPIYRITENNPPVFLYHGQLDFLVTEDQASDYYKALIAAGVETELYLHRWLGHMTMFLFGSDAEDKAIAFLNRKNA